MNENVTVTATTNPLLCVCCNQPVTRPSMGGWGICGLCDTGYCGGKQGHAYAQRFIDELAEVSAALRASRARETRYEAALREAREGLVRGPTDLAAMLDRIDAALAKAAAAPSEGGKE